MSNDIGWASLKVIPVIPNVGSDLSRQLTPGMASAGTAGGKAFGGGMLGASKSFVAPLAGVFAGAMAAGAIVDFFKDAAGAAIEDQKSVVLLAKSMDNLGLSQDNAAAEGFISGLQRATGAADDELR
ncbi:MAG: hypothetical protein PSX37_08920, partial [bacterium]|nr:hypothetical protein [bacterium]